MKTVKKAEKTKDQVSESESLKAKLESIEATKDKAYAEALAKLNKEFGREPAVHSTLYVKRVK